MIKKIVVLACSLVLYSAHAETITINVNSKISIDKNVEENVNALVKEVGKKIHHELSVFRGVMQVETSINSDCGAACKREVALNKECTLETEETAPTQAELKCDSCGQILKSCCGKCSSCSSCSSCSTCCK